MTQALDVYIKAALVPSREPSFELIQQLKSTFGYWAVRLIICLLRSLLLALLCFTSFLAFDPLDFLEEDSPPTHPLSSDDAINTLHKTPFLAPSLALTQSGLEMLVPFGRS